MKIASIFGEKSSVDWPRPKKFWTGVNGNTAGFFL